MKPLLIVPPAPARWTAIENLLAEQRPAWLADLKRRICDALPGARDAMAVIPNGGQVVAAACIRRTHDVGVLGDLLTHAAHRGKGHARRLLQILLSWFDMTGGHWLYTTCDAPLYAGIFEKFGFQPLHHAAHDGREVLTVIRTPATVRGGPLPAEGEAQVRALSRADWPLLVALLQHRAGPDPRVPLAESAVAAETSTMELINQVEQGTAALLGAEISGRIVAAGSVATDQLGQRTFAMCWPHEPPSAVLRAAVIELAASKGYDKVDFPMEILASEGGA